MIVDLGTGDGRAALAAAEANPKTLVLAIDPDAASMADSSRRAARSAKRGGRSNVLFVVAAAESPPDEVRGIADEVRILFPWGSLLRGVLGRESSVAAGVAAIAKPGASLTVLLSVTPRDRIEDLRELDGSAIADLSARFECSGLDLRGARPVSAAEVRATRSTWGRRLLAGGKGRPIWRLDLVADAGHRRPPDGPQRRPAV